MNRLFKVSTISKILFFIFLLTLVSFPDNTLASTKQSKTIKSISDISSTVSENDKYILPATVIAIMNDNSKKNVSIMWNIVTSKSNQSNYIFEGTVQGYNKKVVLTLIIKKYASSTSNINVTSNQGDDFRFSSNSPANVKYSTAIKSISNINATINQGANYTLPSTITAVMSDNSKKKVSVIWSIVTSKCNQTTYVFQGTVQGYNKKVILTLTIKKYIKSIANINTTVNQGDKFSLPGKIAAVMSDNTTQQVPVTWNPSKATTSKAGKFTFQGTVNGYNKKVILTLTVKAKQGNQGNTSGNLANGGLVAQKGDWIYFSNTNASEKLYKMKTDGTGKTKLSDDRSHNINVVGDWVYYSTDKTIYKIKTDGTQKTEIITPVWGIYNTVNVVGDWIYFSDLFSFYKIKADGTQKFSFGIDVNDSIVEGDWIYYTSGSSGLYKMKTDGSGKTQLSDDNCHYINVVGSWIYYSNASVFDYIYKIKTDGTQKIQVNNCISSYVNVVDDWIYYVDESHSGSKSRIYKIKTDGSQETKLNTYISKNLNIAGDWIYYTGYTIYDFTERLYKVKFDGTGNQLVY